MVGKVTIWKMSEEERLEYNKKNPKTYKKNEKVLPFAPDYKWRGKKAAAAKKEQKQAN